MSDQPIDFGTIIAEHGLSEMPAIVALVDHVYWLGYADGRASVMAGTGAATLFRQFVAGEDIPAGSYTSVRAADGKLVRSIQGTDRPRIWIADRPIIRGETVSIPITHVV